MHFVKNTLLIAGLLALVLGLHGCGQTAPPAAEKPVPAAAHADHDDHEEGDDEHGHSHASDAKGKHNHSGWWCNEHGVPEEQCGQCSSKLAAEFQKKGDWCKEHDRPDSQCFVCHPELEGKFAALYEAKYGKKPPQREEE